MAFIMDGRPANLSTDDLQLAIPIYCADGIAGILHIAVYIGNLTAAAYGFNGSETVVASAYLGSGPVFIHIS